MNIFKRARYCAVLVVGLGALEGNIAFADEIRVGLALHDETVLQDRDSVESSGAISVEYIMDSPDWMKKWTLGARPIAYGALNLSGKTNHAGVGLNWRARFLDGLYAEFGTGLSIHDGELTEVNALSITGENDGLENIYGSRVLFRHQIALGYEINEQWNADIFLDHLSHGQILTNNPRNDGLENVGIRIGRKF